MKLKMYDVIIAGSGAAGTFAAYMLKGTNTLVVDTGKRPPTLRFNDDNLYDIRKRKTLFEELIGHRFESLNNIERKQLSPKLKSPLIHYVVEKVKYAPDIQSSTFNPVLSYAEGGLANAWGAQVYRFNNQDLESFPIKAEDLEPYYKKLTKHIGVSGDEDDLKDYHGCSEALLPSLELSAQSYDFLQRYQARRPFFKKRGINIGRPRLAVLSVDYHGRKKCTYNNLEFVQTHLPSIYSPIFTMRSLVEKRQIKYLPGLLIEKFVEKHDHVIVYARNICTGILKTFIGRKLIICTGALNTARIVLYSNSENKQDKLPIIENPCSFTPLISFKRIGMPIEKRSYSSQLNLIYDGKLWPRPVVGMIYGVEGLLRSDILAQFPLTASGSIAVSKYLLPAMSILQVIYPGDGNNRNYLKIDTSGNLIIKYEGLKPYVVERMLIKAFRNIGYHSHSLLVRYPEPGMSIHYGGSLPMKKNPRSYELYPDGRLSGCQHVYVGDSAGFPRLPAKNLTFTIMANSMRIAEGVKKEIEKGN